VTQIITHEGTQWVVEADIKGFFDHVSHGYLMRFLEQRIADPCFLRVIRRFLKAGVMEEGVWNASEEGTPQGGLVSPVLANIYLHYVLDLWFETRFVKLCRGKAYLVRYCDDFIACFEGEEDAKRFRHELTGRLVAFDLEVEPTKTGVLRFGSQAEQDCHKDGRCRPETFNFLGFMHFVGHSRKGRFVVGHKTEGKRFRKKLKGLNQRLRALRVAGGKAMLEYFQHPIRGHIQYYGVSGNIRWVTSRYTLPLSFCSSGSTGVASVAPSTGCSSRSSSSSGYPAFGLSTTFIPRRCIGLKLGAGWCNAPSPVLRGAGDVPGYG
jgi:RNA-directed DNA polymerase